MLGDEPIAETPVGQPLPGYLLHERIGASEGSVVHRAECSGRPGRIVAVKRVASSVAPAALTDLRREAEALRALAHPGILELLDVVPDGTGLALILAYAPGGSLADQLTDGPLRPIEVAELGARLGTTLAAIHRAGLVHGDLKPANILFDREARPLIADLGASRLRGAGPPHAATTGFVAPEVLAGAPLDASADVYGLGILLTEALGFDEHDRDRLRHHDATDAAGRAAPTGPEPPEISDDPDLEALLEAVDAGPLAACAPHVDDGTGGLLTVIGAALADEPSQRPGTALEFAGELERVHRLLQAAHTEAHDATPTDSAATPGDGPARTPAARHRASTRHPDSGGPGHAPTRPFGPAPPAMAPPSPDTELAALARWLAVPALLAVVLTPIAFAVWLVLGATSV